MKKLLTTLMLTLAFVSGAQAQAWPAKPVTLLVPFPPGGSTDLIARTLSTKLQESSAALSSCRTRRAPVVRWVRRQSSVQRPMATPSW